MYPATAMCPVIAVTRAMAHASASSSTSRSYPTTVGRQPRASSARSVCMRARRPSFVEVSAASIDREALQRATEDESVDDGYYAPDEGSAESLMAGELLAGDELHTTPKHIAVCGVASALALALLAEGSQDATQYTTLLAVLCGYVFADFGSGVFHWATDNYGSDKTPVLGGVIAAFQGHHLFPWTITKRAMLNNVHKVAIPTIPFQAAVLVAPAPGYVDTFVAVTCFLVVMSQQFHSWSHSRKSQLPAAVNTLQEMGVLVSRKSHGAHHRKPFASNYCIVSGMWNPILDGTGFFPWLEHAVLGRTGVEPRCWHEPDYTWLTGLPQGKRKSLAAEVALKEAN